MTLYPHQATALKKMEDQQNCAFYHDMGLGKTFTGAEKLNSIGNSMNLLVCQKSKINDWKNHFQQFYPQYFVIDFTKQSKLTAEELVAYNETSKVIIIVNYELAWRRKELAKLSEFTLMLDESSCIQNSKAKQTKFILNLHPSNVILLSGTPCSGKYENLWSQAHLLGWSISQDVYNEQYVNWKLIKVGRTYHKTVDKSNPYKNTDRLKNKLREYGADFLTTDEVMELPEQTFTDLHVPNTKEYKRFMKNSIITIDDRQYIASTPLTKLLYAREIASIENKAKLDALEDLMKSTNDRLIVFYNFTSEMRQIEDLCIKLDRPVSIVNGALKDLLFYEDAQDSVTIVQYQAGAMGLNLQKANKVVFYSPTQRVDLWMQSQKRIHRIGQDKPCFYYRMMTEKSVEEFIYQALERGEDYTLDLFKKEK